MRFAKAQKVDNIIDVLQKVVAVKREKGDQRGCAQLLSEMAVEIFKQQGSRTGTTQSLKSVVNDACNIYVDLSMYEQAIQLCRDCNDSDTLINVALSWIKN